MPNTVDVVSAFQTILQSGLVVSGNSYITVARQLTSGDAMNTFRVSGNTDLITIQFLRNTTQGYPGGVYTKVAADIACEIYVHHPYQGGNTVLGTSGSAIIVEQRVEDFKVTIASGAFNSGFNLSRPILISEASPVMHEKFAKSRLIYRTRFLL